MFIVQLLIFQVVLFVALALGLKKLLGRHATTATAHLQELSQDYVKRHEELKKRLGESERQYQDLLAKAQEEGQQVKRRLLQEGEEKQRKMLEEARQEADRVMQQALRAQENLKVDLEAAVEKQALEKACELIRQVLPQELGKEAHSRWLDEMIQNGFLRMEKLEPSEKVDEALVVSAYPLSASQKERLAGRLKECLKRPVTLKERVDPHLIAGMVVTFGHLVLDGSLASKLRGAVRQSKGEA